MLPGNVTAFTDAPLYARTNGYLVRWYYDIGAKVKKGALLAVIATPEVDQQVAQAEADLATAEANAGNAKAQAERYKGLVDVRRRFEAGHRNAGHAGGIDFVRGQLRAGQRGATQATAGVREDLCAVRRQ